MNYYYNENFVNDTIKLLEINPVNTWILERVVLFEKIQTNYTPKFEINFIYPKFYIEVKV